jgi:TonB family protein
MSKGRLVLFVIICAVVSGWSFVRAQRPVQGPLVTKAVAPSTYPVIALVAHAHGNVIIEVKISPNGEVVSHKVIEGPDLLASTAASAAKLWQFEALPPDAIERSAKLTFEFKIVDKKEDVQIAFSPPYRITYAPMPPVIVNQTNY